MIVCIEVKHQALFRSLFVNPVTIEKIGNEDLLAAHDDCLFIMPLSPFRDELYYKLFSVSCF